MLKNLAVKKKLHLGICLSSHAHGWIAGFSSSFIKWKYHHQTIWVGYSGYLRGNKDLPHYSLICHPDILQTSNCVWRPIFLRDQSFIRGEKQNPKLFEDIQRLFPNAKITNIYASTEWGLCLPPKMIFLV